MLKLDFPGKYSATGLLIVATCCGIWYSWVTKLVPDPYLDEVFHVRQAQVYCSGDFQTWDPKITTPPGLYFLSYGVLRFIGSCDTNALRLTNCGLLCVLVLETYQILRLLTRTRNGNETNDSWHEKGRISIQCHLMHVAINICLFPPVFFFAALYYTDIASLLFVLLSYHASLLVSGETGHSWGLVVLQIFYAVLALLFRQTNVFWVGVFPIGLVAIQLLQRDQHHTAWFSLGVSIDDYIRVTFRIFWLCLSSLPSLLIDTLQHLLVIGFFALFVFWNSGVVLGDKSNHVATIHLPQMLYLWPYITFFSFPILAPIMLAPMIKARSFNPFLMRNRLPRVWTFGLFLVISTTVVHFNTIIHPFTLADNRHYVFYVFKILRQSWIIKYLAVPVYLICGWLVINALHYTGYQDKSKMEVSEPDKATTSQSTTQAQDRRIGFSIIWLATSSLCLITAPLVEPRYFIVSWVVWRLQVASGVIENAAEQPLKESNGGTWSSKVVFNLVCRRETWLWAETIWFLVVNVATCYVFLTRPFEWPLQPGVKQRFMW